MMITMAPTQPPHWAPSPSPTTTTTTTSTPMIPQSSSSSSSSSTTTSSPPSKLPVDFSPPLIAMVVIVATAFLIVTYSRLISRHLLPPILRIRRRFRIWRHRRRRRLHFLPSSVADLDSPPFDPSSFHALSPYGLDESSIKTLPLSLFTKNNSSKSIKEDCAVCLLEFEENDYIRTLPYCAHAFHVDCIDIWLRSHANCPLCRAGIFVTESPFIPVMAARIRPSLDETLLPNIALLETLTESPVRDRVRSFSTVTEITPCVEESPRRLLNLNSEEERFNNDDGGRDLLLKRSYSFGFERSLAAERMMVMEPATASPWRYRRGSFWNKRPSPFGSLTKSRVFSFRHYRGMKSPFFRRRGFFPLSERFVNGGGGGGGGGGSSRRSKSMTSPMFMRSSGLGVAPFSSSRLRCGDPEALLSPERFNRR